MKNHNCCWEQKESPCGIKGSHRCCLCEKSAPTIQNVEEERPEFDVRRDVCEMASEMLDNPKERIYPTTRFYDRMEKYINMRISLARSEGKQEGMQEEAVGCHEHCEQVRAEERKRIKEIIENHGIERSGEWGDGYNDAMDNVLSALEK